MPRTSLVSHGNQHLFIPSQRFTCNASHKSTLSAVSMAPTDMFEDINEYFFPILSIVSYSPLFNSKNSTCECKNYNFLVKYSETIELNLIENPSSISSKQL